MTKIIRTMSTILILLTIFLSPPTTTATTTTTVVRDVTGQPLRANATYYILPVVRGRGGGLTMSPKNSTTPCPLYVAQENQEVSLGLPLKIFPLNYPAQNRITLSTDLNIVFDAATICVQSTGWRLTLDEATGRRYVGTQGSIGEPGVKTLDNWFKIEEVDVGKFYYKIVYCPSVCKFCKVMCGDIGVFSDEKGMRLLGLNEKSLLIMFKKA